MFLLRSIFLKTLRDLRGGILGWGLGLAALMLIGLAEYPSVIKSQQAAGSADLTQVLQAFSFLTGKVVAVNTLGGYTTTRILGLIPMILGLWAMIVGVGQIRGEEQAGTMEVLLATPKSRATVFLQKALGLLAGMAIAIILIGLGLLVGIVLAGESPDVGAVALVSLNILAIIGFWSAVGLLAGQFTVARRTASGAVGGLMVATYFLNNIFETTPSLEGLSWLTPFHYYSLSKPLVPSIGFNAGWWLALVVAVVVLAALAGYIFARRDVGASFSALPSRQAADGAATRRQPSVALLGSVLGKSIRDLIWSTLAWGVGLGLYAVGIIATTKEVLKPLQDLAKSAEWLSRIIGSINTNEAYLDVGLFTYFPLLLTVYSIIQVNNWASDEEEGRFELLLSTPVSRWQLLAARYVAMILSLSAVLAITAVFIFVSAGTSGVQIDVGRVIGALFATMPVALVVAAFGLTIATWPERPSYAMPVTITLVLVMYFFEIIARLFDLPEAALNVSIFHLYGRPLVQGIAWGGFLALTAATAILVATSLVGFSRRDIAK